MEIDYCGYEKAPYIEISAKRPADGLQGYEKIGLALKTEIANLRKKRIIVAIDCYPGVKVNEIAEKLLPWLKPKQVIYTDDTIFQSSQIISQTIRFLMTEDRVFGKMCPLWLEDFIDEQALTKTKADVANQSGVVLVYGVGAGLVGEPDVLVYADLARWEIQRRYRSGELENWKADTKETDVLKKFKRGYFFEWRIADRHKRDLFERMDYLLDTNQTDQPKLISADTYLEGLAGVAHRPFRVVPFFDPGVWGGQWLRQICGLDQEPQNYAWAFDCVPEENSILLKVGDTIIETPAINLVFLHPYELLGDPVVARFGYEFPIRFDFLDTMDGQNLSLQVHPTKDYIKNHFGMDYTQDESYYVMDAKPGAGVYLGVKTGTDAKSLVEALNQAQEDNVFAANQYINFIPAQKHDHFLIPAGTIHCSGKDTVILEISATPYIFTFKLWDWNRLGLDGRPRPVHIEHGQSVIQYHRDTEWVRHNLVNRVQLIKSGDSWREERTGLHELEFIETRRYHFNGKIKLNTNQSVNVLNLVEGVTCAVESVDGSFEPFLINYAETFIVPAAVVEYTVRPIDEENKQEMKLICAYVRVGG